MFHTFTYVVKKFGRKICNVNSSCTRHRIVDYKFFVGVKGDVQFISFQTRSVFVGLNTCAPRNRKQNHAMPYILSIIWLGDLDLKRLK